MNIEFVVVSFVYMFVINFVMKKAGGVELKLLEKDIKKLLKDARSGDNEAMGKLNKANSKRMKLAMKSQLYLFPIIVPALFLIKKRYVDLTWVIFGHQFGWLGAFIILGIPLSIISDKIVRKLLKYS